MRKSSPFRERTSHLYPLPLGERVGVRGRKENEE